MKTTWNEDTRARLVRELRECADSTALVTVSNALRHAARDVSRIPARRVDPEQREGAGAAVWGFLFALAAVGFAAVLCALAESA